jgi:hypothetical protein
MRILFVSWFACKIENEKEYSSLNFNNSDLNDVKHIIINTLSSDKAIKLILFYYTKKFINKDIELEINNDFQHLYKHYCNTPLNSIENRGIPTITGEFFRKYFCHYRIGKSRDIFYKTDDLSIEEFMKTKNYETTLLIDNYNNFMLYKKDEN